MRTIFRKSSKRFLGIFRNFVTGSKQAFIYSEIYSESQFNQSSLPDSLATQICDRAPCHCGDRLIRRLGQVIVFTPSSLGEFLSKAG